MQILYKYDHILNLFKNSINCDEVNSINCDAVF